jgi:tRNA pseudouridine38-40 synthase
MPRYFIEVTYKGTRYSGFQIQENAVTIQSEVKKALFTFFRQSFQLTGSSRTDAGVHALQNFFHFDTDISMQQQQLYHLNAILPNDIVIKNILPVVNTAHCRFDALSREYVYYIYQNKNPFVEDRAWYYPYAIDFAMLNEAAAIVFQHDDFTSFSKRNTQVNNFICKIETSFWEEKDGFLIYHVKANRFLRGMVRGLVGTMLKVAREKVSIGEFKSIIEARDCTRADFKTPAQGLFLKEVSYPARIFLQSTHDISGK